MQIDDINGFTPRTVPPGAPGPSARASGTEPARFARVFELAEARRTRPLPEAASESIPPEVWAEVDRAHRLADELAARGQEVRFETHHLSGRVVANLCDRDGGLVRPLALTELVPSAPGSRFDEAVR